MSNTFVSNRGRKSDKVCQRTIIVAASVAMMSSFALQVHAQQTPNRQGAIVVTLLGTGTPVPLLDRFGPSTLVEAGAHRFLIDAGRGAPIRLNQLRINLGSIDAIFLTLFHSDHLNGLPDIWMTSYIPVGFGNRTKPLQLVGPDGTKQIAERMRLTFSDDIRIRMADEHVFHEFPDEGVVFDEGGVRVTAFHVNYGPLIKPSYGYRLDYAAHSVLISGDTKYEPNIIKYGAGVDLLPHEVCAVPDAMHDLPNIKQVIEHHTSPQGAGRIFSQVKPKLAAYTHLMLLGTPENPPLTAADVEKQTRETYTGPLSLGEDLMRFTVGSDILVQKWNASRGATRVERLNRGIFLSEYD